jgi:hypothetical protein
VTLEEGMCLTTYYLSLFQVNQVHAKQDALNEGHHQLQHLDHGAKQIFWHRQQSQPLLPPLSQS